MAGFQGVSWRDYAGLESMPGLFEGGGEGEGAGGIVSAADVDALNKALVAGGDINNPGSGAGVGFPLRVESLDKLLYVTSFRAQDIKFWKTLFKDPAYNTVEEFNRLEEYGSSESAFMAEGDLAVEDDSTYSRQYTKIKFLGTTRRVTHVMSLLRAAHGNAVARESVNGTLWLLRQIERSLFIGDERLIPIQFDGLEKSLVNAWGSTELDDLQLSGYEDDNVIDMRGAALSEDHIADMAERLVAEPNFGQPSDLWMPTGPVKDLSKILYPKERYDLPAPQGGMAGISIKGVRTPFGDINLNPDIFIPDSVLAPAAAAGPAAQRPGTPAVGVLASPLYGGPNTTYWAAGDVGTYIYKVVAASRYGKSAPVTTASIAVAAGDQVDIPVTDAGPGTTFYDVYRSDKNGAASTARHIMRVRRTGAVQTIVDLNRFLPNTSKGYMLTQSPEVLKWKQLAPFTKIPLATIDSSIRWMMVLYGALQVMKPLQNGMFINIGKLPTGANA